MNAKGLSTSEAQALLRAHGPNLIPEKKPVTLFQRFLNQFRSALIYVRVLLRLEKPSVESLVLVGGCVLLTFGVAEVYSRVIQRRTE